MKYKLTALTLILALSTIMMSPAVAAAQSATGGNLALPIAGTANDGALKLAGTFNLQRVAVQDGKLVGIGTLVVTVRDAVSGDFVRNIVAGGFTMPLTASTLPAEEQATAAPAQAQATCPILHLELGPLDLNLLGLMVHLDKVVLDITAQSGPGNLLGNLLCAVANLLNGGGPLQQIANLLNQILNLLG